LFFKSLAFKGIYSLNKFFLLFFFFFFFVARDLTSLFLCQLARQLLLCQKLNAEGLLFLSFSSARAENTRLHILALCAHLDVFAVAPRSRCQETCQRWGTPASHSLFLCVHFLFCIVLILVLFPLHFPAACCNLFPAASRNLFRSICAQL
jgi:hypothetical protein